MDGEINAVKTVFMGTDHIGLTTSVAIGHLVAEVAEGRTYAGRTGFSGGTGASRPGAPGSRFQLAAVERQGRLGLALSPLLAGSPHMPDRLW